MKAELRYEPRCDPPDDLDRLLAEKMKDPAFAAAYADAKERHRVLDALLVRRRDVGLSQKKLAKRMGIKQPSVSEFEAEASDPRLSTLQRYARALGMSVRIDLEVTPVPRPGWAVPGTTEGAE